ncbi:ATP-binding protein [Haloarcula amylolytica]|uniref:ATP-binding protein n=1 Tax=Haloarcula amylolytica TaxID=396317 RepID=UPI003C77D493
MRTDRATEVLFEVAHEDIIDLAQAYPDQRVLEIDWQAISDVDAGLADDLLSRPEQSLPDFEEALRQYDIQATDVDGPVLARATVRLENLPDEHTHPVAGYSPSSYINRLMALDGQITKRTEVQPAIAEAAYKCVYCGALIRVPQPPFGGRERPDECSAEKCPSHNPQMRPGFSLETGRSEWTDYQKVRLQKPPEDAHGESETIDFHVNGDLAGDEAITGGSRVTLVGRFVPVDEYGTVNFDQTLVANNVIPEGDVYGDVEIGRYLEDIKAIASDNPRERLQKAFAPGVAGYPQEKRALLLQMFGGWSKTAPDGNYHRGDSHIYLIGDPGVGKSVLLRAVYEVAPRAALTDGTGSSGAGLTAALNKDDFGDGQWTIEAGTLVRASGGIAAIDELDKGDNSELQAMHTALEAQKVHVSKAGKNATLPAKTAVLAAGNPTGGHFDPTKEFAAQVDLESPLLSRFDLIFTVRERYKEDKIQNVANIMVEGRDAAARLQHDEDLPEELASLVEPKLDPDLFQSYIAHARQEYEPVATEAVKQRMKDWYTELKTTLPDRYTSAMEDDGRDYDGPPLPVTARKLDACYRLAEASARMRLSDTVEMTDIEFVTPLIERSLADIGIAPQSNAALGSVDDLDAGEVGL